MMHAKQRGIYSEYLLDIDGSKQSQSKQNFNTGPSPSFFLTTENAQNDKKKSKENKIENPIQKLKDLQRVSLKSSEQQTHPPQFDLKSFNNTYTGFIKYRSKNGQVQNNLIMIGKNGDFTERLQVKDLMVEPKAMEPFEPVLGRVPRKIVIERKRIQFSSFDFQKYLQYSPLVELLQKFESKKNFEWISLDCFDDESFNDYSVEEWIEKAQKGSNNFTYIDENEQALNKNGKLFIKGHALSQKGQIVSIRPVVIERFDDKTKEFIGFWKDNKSDLKLSKIFVCFESEDPQKWLAKLEKAVRLKNEAIINLKYNFMIDRMSVDDLNDMDSEQKQRLIRQAGLASKFKSVDSEECLEEVQTQYQRSMNKIIFDKYFPQLATKFAIVDIVELKKTKELKKKRKNNNKKLQNCKGLANPFNQREHETIAQKDDTFEITKPQVFGEVFKEFCFSSLFIKEEAIDALQQIKAACQSVLKLSFFVVKHEGAPKRLDEFKTIQESSISQTISYLKNNWVKSLIDIIKRKFSDIGKGWFNMKETNRLTYEFGKLKRFLTVVRLNMQDCLKKLLRNSLREFVDSFKHSLPESVNIISQNKVENMFASGAISHPILSLDLVQVVNKEEFNYLFKPDRICADILELFEKAIDELKKVPDLEPKILESLHKAKKSDTYVITPVLPKEKPEASDPNVVPRRYCDENKWLWDLYQEFSVILSKATQPLEEFKSQFKSYQSVLGLKVEEQTGRGVNEDAHDETETFKAELRKWKQEEQKLKENILEEVQVSCFSINCKETLRILTGKYQEICKKQIEELVKSLKEKSKTIQKKVGDIEKEVQRQLNTIEEMIELKSYIANELPKQIDSLKQETADWIAVVDLLENQRFKLPKDDLAKRWKLLAGPKELMTVVKEKEKGWDKLANKFNDQMILEQEEFNHEVNNVEADVLNFHTHNNLSEYLEKGELVSKMNEKLEEMQSRAKMFNKREGLLEKSTLTDYSRIQKLIKAFSPYLVYWNTISYWMQNFPKWMNDEFSQVDAESSERFVENELKNFIGVLKQFKDKTKGEDGAKFKKILEVGETVLVDIENFKEKVPILVALKKEGMRERHWEDLVKRTNLDIKIDKDATFETLLKMGLDKYSNVCVEIGEKANREFSIEKSLAQMYKEWENIDFALNKFKETGSFVITNFDFIETFLDQHLTDTQTLLINPFKKPFSDDIDKWYENLLTISNIIDEWRRFQGQWCYLQPIFDSPDIKKQLPNESALFKRVDGNWRQTLSQTKIQKNVLKVCTTEGYIDKFKDANVSLDKIQKELRTYLELKRSKFGRFYFLSNDDLLSILSETKDVEKVQDHLRKVFENIARLTFTTDKKIIAMSSVENETVPFDKKSVDPSMRQVEDWMSDVENSMMGAVKDHFYQAVQAYPTQQRNQWILWPPGQCVLNGSQVHWTLETEQAIQNNTVTFYLQKLEDQLKELVTIDRVKLSSNQFVTLEALIVIDVHAKDVVDKLVKAETTSVFDFEWISQLRYYWEDDNVKVKCLQTNYKYGYEYLGNTPRLVITPLTDKCYMTLMSAIKLNLGGAPAGPAGTGKTESTKDLAKALAKQCVVFNCQESMDYNFVGKFFKGLASSGAWCCFDEFNRINLEVLSVIAQQLQELFRAIAEKLDHLVFEGSEIRLKEGFSVFITMNPGYAGRTELPDNLKALFRSVAMMVPDYALIAEIKLYSFGFIKARELARKMVATFKLSSEQLSSQYHYDYGMRAVTSVINAAGLLKRDDKENTPEDVLLLRSLRDVNLPKFLKEDIPLFGNIIKDLFPTTPDPKYDFSKLMPKIKEACSFFNLEPVDGFLTKVMELYNTMLVRHGLMLVGPAGGGKTCAYKVLQRAISELARESPEITSKVNVEVLNPKSISMTQLYGEYREMNWNEGIIEIVFEKAIKAQFDNNKANEKWWIMFDGPVDALWIESMNTVLDDNKKLCLSSGKVLILSKLMTIMFEVEDLKEASPATVSRCGMVYMEPESIPASTLLSSFVKQIQDKFEVDQCFGPLFVKSAQVILLPMLKFMRLNCKEIMKTVDNNIIASFCRLYGCFIEDYNDLFKPISISSNNKEKVSEEMKNLRRIEIENIMWNLALFCTVWSAGCTSDHESRGLFVNELKKTIENDLSMSLLFKIKDDFFDYKYIITENQFVLWLTPEAQTSIDYSLKNTFNDIIVPTVDSVRTIFIAETLLKHGKMVFTPGPPGTGKTTNAYSLLTDKLTEKFISLSMTFSAQTNSNQVLETIFSQLSKRKRGIYGPPSGKQIVVFIDDLNMPKKEQYGAQPPVELLREFIDHSMVYVWKMNKEHLKFEDVLLLGSMGPSGGGRSELSQRFNRHFNCVAYTELDQSVICSIFSVILNTLCKKYSESVKNSIDGLLKMTCMVFNNIRSHLLPIPSKSHYLFTLRDFSRVMSGLCSSSHATIKTRRDVIELWAHESFRVFHDRMINKDDRVFFCDQIQEAISCYFCEEIQEFGNVNERFSIGPERVIFFRSDDGPGGDYCKVESSHEFMVHLYDVQKEYNREATGGKPKINLVLFLDACEHIAKIARVLHQPQGHMLLLGVGGSGKQSLTRLAVFLSNHYLFGIEVVKGYNIVKWREDLKRLVYMSITESNQVTFMISDTQLISEQFVEDLSCLMNTGFLLGLPFNAEEIKKIDTVAKADCSTNNLVPNKINLQQMQIQRFKKNTHIVFCMSPLSNQFANRLRMFPAIVGCCTIDWFLEWPHEALKSVAKDFLEEMEETRSFIAPVDTLTNFFSNAHLLIQEQNVNFKKELGRINYNTPTSYLELLKTFAVVFEQKTRENFEALKRLENGVTKLKEANLDVERLQTQLMEEEPILRQNEEEVRLMIQRVEADQQIADEKKKIVEVEEAEAKKAQDEAIEIAEKVKLEVDEADKELEKTLEKVGLLNQGHINEFNAFQNPPSKIKYVFMATCVLILDPSMIQIKSSWNDDEVEAFFWKLAKLECIKDSLFLSKLKGINFQKVEISRIKKIRELVVDHPKRAKTWVDNEMQRSNIANYCLFLLVNAVIRFNELFEKTKPLRKQQEDVMIELEKKKEFLFEKNQELAIVNEKLAKLQSVLDEKNKEISELRLKIDTSTQKLERAKKLTDLLSDENQRWNEEIKSLKEAGKLIEGNTSLAAVMINYAGPFNAQFRSQIEAKLTHLLGLLHISMTPGITMKKLLAEEIKVLQWSLDGLPKDDSSMENAIIMENSARWSFIIDPQRQAFNFLKNSAKNGQMVQIVKNGSSNMLKELEQSVQFGKWMLIENCTAELDPLLEPIIAKNISKSGGTLQIMIGEKFMPYSEKFKLVLLTTIQNPIFSPEVCAKASIVNFSITLSGLEEQMLAKIVNIENRQLEDQKSDIVTKNVEEKQKLLRLEDNILKTLSESKNDFLENSNLINQLASSKVQSNQIKAKVIESKAIEENIDSIREKYRKLAQRVSLLFFCTSSMINIDPMYEFSLEWYKELFKNCVESTVTDPGVDRLEILTNTFTLFLFKNVCRSIFEKHKLMYSFLMSVGILEKNGQILTNELQFLLTLSFMDCLELPKNPTKNLPETSWKAIFKALYALSRLERWKNIDTLFVGHSEIFETFQTSNSPETSEFHEIYIDKGYPTDPFSRLVLMKVFRPDKLLPAMQNFIISTMTQKFIEFTAPQLSEIFESSTQMTPLMIILSPGSDPKADFDRLVEEKEIRTVLSISLGQGQGEKAEKLINEAIKNGYWVLLQNCHLAASWMPVLESLVFSLSAMVHKEFRLWLTTAPTTVFPVAVLQNSLRITMEPPQDLRSNLLKSYNTIDTRGLSEQTETYKSLLYGLCFFHAVAQNRKNFGPIGWNIPYQFTLEDLQVSQRMLELYLNEYKIVPYKVLNFVFSEINYGGRVTDDIDLRLLKALMRVYVCPEALKENYSFSESGLYMTSNLKDLSEYVKHIKSLPVTTTPEVFFLHSNAEIVTNQDNSQEFIETIVSVKGSSNASSSIGGEGDMNQLIDELLLKCPPCFDVPSIVKKYPVEYTESMNTVLTQEIIRYNRLIIVFQKHLIELQKALKGEIGFSEELENIVKSLNVRQVPSVWHYPLGFLSLKPLSSWMEEFTQRIGFFTKWIDNGKPPLYWFSGFFFPQAFITGTLQNYARKYKLAIDRLSFHFKIRDDLTVSSVTEAPKDGCYIYGLFLEGASWNFSKHMLDNPIPRELYSVLPIIELIPAIDKSDNFVNVYRCPLYKVLSRAGTLSTTGHSTNFIMILELPTDQSEDSWIRKGVAAFQSLKY